MYQPKYQFFREITTTLGNNFSTIITFHFQLPNVVGDAMTRLFEVEDSILVSSKSSDVYGELGVNKALIDLHLKSPLSLRRNAQMFPKNRDMVGGFIFKSLAKSGLMVKSEEFQFQKVTIDIEVSGSKRRRSSLIIFWLLYFCD